MAYIKLPERTSEDSNSSADINQLTENIEVVKSSLESSQSDITDIFNALEYKPGQIIEYLSSPCDGSTVNGKVWNYTWPTVSAAQTESYDYVDLTGSSIEYLPPTGTTKVVYRFTYSTYIYAGTPIGHTKFYIGADEVLYARTTEVAAYLGGRSIFEWTINIGGSANENVGRLASWTSAKTLKLKWRVLNGSNIQRLHGTYYWDGSVGSNQFSMPVLTIIAIA